MKTTALLLFLVLSSILFGQSKSDLNNRILSLESRMASMEKELNQSVHEKNLLRIKVDSLKSELAQVKLNLSQKQQVTPETATQTETVTTVQTKKRCKANTASGKQCSRDAQDGSEYCWQHRPTYEPGSTNKENTNTGVKSGSSGGTNSGREILTGPRGGKYYINANGKKTYIKK